LDFEQSYRCLSDDICQGLFDSLSPLERSMAETGRTIPHASGQASPANIAQPSVPSQNAGYSILIGSVGEFETRLDRTAHPDSLAWISTSNIASAHAAGLAGESLFYQRRYPEAVRQFQNAVRLAPNDPLLHFRLAYCAWRANDLALVEPHLNLAIRIDPHFASAHDALGQWHLFKAQYGPALTHSAIALQLSPANPDVIVSRAFVLAGFGDADAAWELIRPHMGNGALAERLAILYLQIASRIGHEQQAADWALQHLSRSMFPPAERPQLLFALSGVLDRLGQYDQAFAHARAARQLLHIPYNPDDHNRAISRRIEFFSPARMRSLPRAKHGSRRPVFIVGMPRSGTSLVEQILACHSDVHGAGELEDLLRIVSPFYDGRRGTGPQSSGGSSAPDVEQMAREYLSIIESLNSSARYVTDKNPLNFTELGLIEQLFPDCRIIHCVRNPMDTCLSCYMTDISAGVTFCRDQSTLARYYNQYARLMAHWSQVLTVPILTVRYEDVVDDLSAQSHRILHFLDLPWEDRCLDFHANRRPVATASREQVRKPIYVSSVGRWQHYQQHLDELAVGISNVSPAT
jgi:Flp pilus assembly protein TadD